MPDHAYAYVLGPTELAWKNADWAAILERVRSALRNFAHLKMDQYPVLQAMHELEVMFAELVRQYHKDTHGSPRGLPPGEPEHLVELAHNLIRETEIECDPKDLIGIVEQVVKVKVRVVEIVDELARSDGRPIATDSLTEISKLAADDIERTIEAVERSLRPGTTQLLKGLTFDRTSLLKRATDHALELERPSTAQVVAYLGLGVCAAAMEEAENTKDLILISHCCTHRIATLLDRKARAPSPLSSASARSSSPGLLSVASGSSVGVLSDED